MVQKEKKYYGKMCGMSGHLPSTALFVHYFVKPHLIWLSDKEKEEAIWQFVRNTTKQHIHFSQWKTLDDAKCYL